jgi:hypothetical protein
LEDEKSSKNNKQYSALQNYPHKEELNSMHLETRTSQYLTKHSYHVLASKGSMIQNPKKRKKGTIEYGPPLRYWKHCCPQKIPAAKQQNNKNIFFFNS